MFVILKESIQYSIYLSSIFHIVLLAWKGANTAGGGGAALFSPAEHDGILVEVSCSLHRH